MNLRAVPFVLAATDQGTFILNYRDAKLSDPNRGIGIGFQLLSRGSAEAEEVNELLSVLEARRERFGDGVVAVDCGANIGVFTCVWARAMLGWGSVIAIEAQPRIYYALCGNIAINNVFNAHAFNVAAGETAGWIEFATPDYTEYGSFGSLELRPQGEPEDIGQPLNRDRPNCRVRVVPVDSLGLRRCDLLKIDVEGMEAEVLRGARETIRKHRPMIFVELGKAPQQEIDAELMMHDYGVRELPSGWLCCPREQDAGG